MSKYSNGIFILVAALIIAGAVIYEGKIGQLGARPSPAQPAAVQPSATGPSVDVKNVNTVNEPYIGSTSAPLTIAYWSDYQCPFCQRFDLQTLPSVITNYVSTNKVRIVFKDFQFLGADSDTAAIAARAIWENYPNQYFAWREAMYKNQGPENSGYDSKANVIKLTATIPGIDANKVSVLMDQNNAKYQAEIDADKAEAGNFGVDGTPGFVVGKQFVSGAVSFASISQTIDAQLK